VGDEKKKEFEIQHVKGSGPGGQHRNKRQTGILIKHVPTGITVRSTERRSQRQNLSEALDRLESKVEAHFYRPPKRRKTKKSKASQQERLRHKARHGAKKSLRKKGRFED